MCHVGRLPTQVGEEVLGSFCDCQDGASFWGAVAAGAKTSRPEKAAAETQSGKALGKSWPDFVELVHGCERHSCAK